MRTTPPPKKKMTVWHLRKWQKQEGHNLTFFCPSPLKQVVKARKGVLPFSWSRLRDPHVISACSILGGKGILISEDTGPQIIICTGLANFPQVYYQWIISFVPHPHLSITEYFIRWHKKTELKLIVHVFMSESSPVSLYRSILINFSFIIGHLAIKMEENSFLLTVFNLKLSI